MWPRLSWVSSGFDLLDKRQSMFFASSSRRVEMRSMMSVLANVLRLRMHQSLFGLCQRYRYKIEAGRDL